MTFRSSRSGFLATAQTIRSKPEPSGALPNKAAEADGRTGQRNRSAVLVRVPRGGAPMVSSMPAAAQRPDVGRHEN